MTSFAEATGQVSRWQPVWVLLAMVVAACGTPDDDASRTEPTVPMSPTGSPSIPSSSDPSVIPEPVPVPSPTDPPITDPVPGPVVNWPGARPALRLASNERGNCAILEDRQAACWGGPVVRPREDEYKQVSGSGTVMCGLSTRGRVSCWSGGASEEQQPTGEGFKSVYGSTRLGCATGADDLVVCWGDPTEPEALNPPTEPLSGVSMGWGTGCGFTNSGEIACWGRIGPSIAVASRIQPDRSDYVALYLGGTACGIYGQGRVGCWSKLSSIRPSTDEGYVQVASDVSVLCALHMSGRVDCTGSVAEGWRTNAGTVAYPSEARFEEISVGPEWACGITTERTVRCWGEGNGAASPGADFRVISLEDNVQ